MFGAPQFLSVENWLKPSRIASTLSKVLLLTILPVIVGPVFAPSTFGLSANAATLIDNKNSFLQWTSWLPDGVGTTNTYTGANHLPYSNQSANQLTSNGDQIALTNTGASQSGYLWNTTQYSYANDFTVTANWYLGQKDADGADGMSFVMRPLNLWPNGGTAAGSGSSHSRTTNNQIKVMVDTYQNGSEIADDHLSIYSRNSSGVETVYGGNGVVLKDANCNNVANVENNSYTNFYTVQWIASSRTLKFFAGEEANCEIFSTVISVTEQDATTFAWGFQAETGGSNNYQMIGNVKYSFRNVPATTDSDTALSFNGSNQYAAAPSDGTGSIYDFGSSWTTQAWIKPGANCVAGYCNIIGKEYSFLISTIGNKLIFCTGNGSGWNIIWREAGGFIPTGAWSHVAATYSGTTLTIYLNGRPIHVSTSVAAVGNNAERFTIGGRTVLATGDASYERFQGEIDEVRVWNSARSEANIESDMHNRPTLSDANLKAYFDFNEGSGSSLVNRAANSLAQTDLSLAGAPSWQEVSGVTVSGPYTVATFTRSYLTAGGGWKTPLNTFKVSTVVVAGGGGGGADSDDTGWMGGGGGAGGYQFSNVSVSANSEFVTLKVGMGGRAGQQVALGGVTVTPTNGADSQFKSLTSIGGGAGGISYNNVNTNGAAGGSGGGGATYSGAGGAGTAGQGNNGGSAGSSCCAGGGGGGAGSVGGAGVPGASVSQSVGGSAGDGVLNPLYIAGVSAEYLAAGGAGLGYTTAGSAGIKGGTPVFTNATANSGSGGGGGGSSQTQPDKSGGFGGAGVIVVRWITAAKPIFTGPTFDTLTAGLIETFTVSGAPTPSLTRNFRWQTSNDTGTTWSNTSEGSGFLTSSYVSPTLETNTSGIRYQYRVVVTDSDTAGLFIVDTSTAVFLTINPRNTITSSTGSAIFTQKYGESRTAVFTFAFGTGTRTPTVVSTTNNQNGRITWSNLTSESATVRVGTGLPVGTYSETLTVTDSVTAFTTQAISITVSKADTITVTTTLSANSVTYNEAPAAITTTQTVTGLVNSETATVTSTYREDPCVYGGSCLASATIPTDAGVYKVGSTFSISSPASLSNYQGVESVTATLTINQARQTAITIGQYLAYPNISSYPLNVYGGSGPGVLTRTLVSAGTAGCSLAASFILTATSVGSCTVKAEKAGTRNYIVESTTATIYWIAFVTNYAAQALEGNNVIPLAGGNQIIVRTETLTASAFSNTSGGAITSAAVGATIRINSTGFAGLSTSDLSVTFRTYEDAVINAVTSTYVEVVIPSGAVTGVIAIDSPRGVAYTQSFTISP